MASAIVATEQHGFLNIGMFVEKRFGQPQGIFAYAPRGVGQGAEDEGGVKRAEPFERPKGLEPALRQLSFGATIARSGPVAARSCRSTSSCWAVSRCQALGESSAAAIAVVLRPARRGTGEASCRRERRGRCGRAPSRPENRARAEATAECIADARSRAVHRRDIKRAVRSDL